MSTHKLEKIFNPKSIAVVGATERPGAVGQLVFKNLLEQGYTGKLFPVNLKHETVQGVPCYYSVDALPVLPDLVLIATPASTVPALLKQCGELGISGVAILSGGFKEAGKKGQKLYKEIGRIARKYQIRILGPNCLGYINPHRKINATFGIQMALPGRIAFISQSGALCTAILDWANSEQVGFSYFVSIGSMLDISFDDLIDYFGQDARTSSILIYMESLTDARRFMSAARAFSLRKPILVLKAGRSEAGARATQSHTGSLAGNDAAFEAAFRRCGVIRVDTISQLFNCAQALAMQPRPRGNRLLIVSNAGGPGVLATDYLMRNEGDLAPLSEATLTQLDAVLPEVWSRQNPIDMIGDATPERFAATLKICLTEPQADGVLVILAPQGISDAAEVASILVEAAKQANKPVLAAWMGESEVEQGRKILENGNIPAYRFPESAVDVFLKMWAHERNLQIHNETPPSIPSRFEPDRARVRRLIDTALEEGRDSLTEVESKEVLDAYQIPIPQVLRANTEAGVRKAVKQLGFPLVMKLEADNLFHKTEIGGVVLDLRTEKEALQNFRQMMERVQRLKPQLKVHGVLLEPMIKKRYELIIGAHKDPIFGPVLVFGLGGVAVEVFHDRNVGLPPLNMALAMRLMENTRVFKLLKGYRSMPGVDLSSIQFVLYKFAYLVMDFPEIREADINPFAADEHGGIALDAAIRLDTRKDAMPNRPYGHLVISPYPEQYQSTITLRSGKEVLLRPIRSEDEPLVVEMLKFCSKESLYYRFLGYIPKITHELLIRFTQNDYDRELAIVAELEEDGERKLLGVVRLVADAWNERAEYAILVADPWQKEGLGKQMTDFILNIARERNILVVYASVLVGNTGMLRVFEKLGFKRKKEDFETYSVSYEL